MTRLSRNTTTDAHDGDDFAAWAAAPDGPATFRFDGTGWIRQDDEAPRQESSVCPGGGGDATQ